MHLMHGAVDCIVLANRRRPDVGWAASNAYQNSWSGDQNHSSSKCFFIPYHRSFLKSQKNHALCRRLQIVSKICQWTVAQLKRVGLDVGWASNKLHYSCTTGIRFISLRSVSSFHTIAVFHHREKIMHGAVDCSASAEPVNGQ
jgi:hypothetical protein